MTRASTDNRGATIHYVKSAPGPAAPIHSPGASPGYTSGEIAAANKSVGVATAQSYFKYGGEDPRPVTRNVAAPMTSEPIQISSSAIAPIAPAETKLPMSQMVSQVSAIAPTPDVLASFPNAAPKLPMSQMATPMKDSQIQQAQATIIALAPGQADAIRSTAAYNAVRSQVVELMPGIDPNTVINKYQNLSPSELRNAIKRDYGVDMKLAIDRAVSNSDARIKEATSGNERTRNVGLLGLEWLGTPKVAVQGSEGTYTISPKYSTGGGTRGGSAGVVSYLTNSMGQTVGEVQTDKSGKIVGGLRYDQPRSPDVSYPKAPNVIQMSRADVLALLSPSAASGQAVSPPPAPAASPPASASQYLQQI